MAIGRTNCGVGGGLNFQVVGGTTQPASPKENTIWVNTDTKITSYVFSATEPESPVDGMVWIVVGSTGSVEIPVTEKNPIMVYPISAKQYISDAWVDKTAKSYQNGEWKEFFVWDGQIYEEGNEFISQTGGLEFTQAASDLPQGSGTKKATSVLIECNSEGTSINAVTSKMVDVTNYSTLYCNVTAYSNHGGIAIGKKQVMGEGAAIIGFTGTGTFSLDISKYSGSYYIGVQSAYSWGGKACKVEFDKIWME